MRQEIDYIDPADADALDLTEQTILVNRSAKVMKGGRRFGFGALVVVGDGRGVVGLGYGKAREVPPAIEKAISDAKKHLVRISLVNATFPHPTVSRFRSSVVKLIPASAGTGVRAGKAVRAVLEAAGVTDALTKALGSKNEANLAKATFQGLLSMRRREEVAAVRGLELR